MSRPLVKPDQMNTGSFFFIRLDCLCIFLLCPLLFQLSQCQDRMLELERMLENPMDETRVRFLEGKDLAPAQLSGKVEQVRKHARPGSFTL